MSELEVRRAVAGDAVAIAHLIWGLRDQFLSAPEVTLSEAFVQSTSEMGIIECIHDPNACYVVACVQAVVVGAACMKNHGHLHHMFVAAAHQRRGIARQMWERLLWEARQASAPAQLTVNASLMAVEVYRRWGFVQVGGPQVRDGLAYQAMKLDLTLKK